MNQPRTCDPTTIELFFADKLVGAEQLAFERHLDECSSCRAAIEHVAADAIWWDDAQQYLSSSADEQPTAPATVDTSRIRDFLNPTDDPRMLGRFGGYEIAGIVGCGGMGIVLKGFDVALNRYVAIKALAPHLAANAGARRRFAREAQAAAAVVHENVIAIHGVSEENGLPYLVMPYFRGSSLQKRLDSVGPLATCEVLRVAMQTAYGLAAAHAQGLVHRDIKPANILLADGVERVKITDFGLARAADDASLTHSGIIAGTPQYMSPEQARGEAIDARSDLFSLGSVMYAMIAGHPPFRAETSFGVLQRIGQSRPRPLRDISPETPPWLCRLIDRLHAKSPDDRYPTATAAARDLEACLAHLQNASEPLPEWLTPRDSWKNWYTDRWWPAWVAVAGAAVIACIVWATWRQPPSNDPTSARSPAVVDSDQNSPATEATSQPVDPIWEDGSSEAIDTITDEIEELMDRDDDWIEQ